jgi:L-lactate dehydrogenase complex protein LldG
MPTAREQILRDVRSTLPVEAALPPLDGPWTQYGDSRQQFIEVLRAVGGVGKSVASVEVLRGEIVKVADAIQAHQICSVLPEAFAGNVDLAGVDDPHQLADVDLAVLPGEIAVAENAAVWVTGRLVPERVLYFLSQHVVLVVPASGLVSNMHEAYARLRTEAAGGELFATPKWGAFMSGPSKTADIEQALVIGAHGARSLHVFLLEE